MYGLLLIFCWVVWKTFTPALTKLLNALVAAFLGTIN